jgi:hypothetical protein
MTRVVAIFLSYFGPTVPGILIWLFFSLFENEPPIPVIATSAAAFVVAALFIRVYFAMYARDKDRSGALGLLALFGWLGWLFLIVTEDRKRDAGTGLQSTNQSPG